MSREMVERVARAINPVAWLVESHFAQREAAMEAAVRALEAMREPTLDMCVAYENAMKSHIDKLPESLRHKRNYYPRGYLVPEAIKLKVRYRAMIDAALR